MNIFGYTLIRTSELKRVNDETGDYLDAIHEKNKLIKDQCSMLDLYSKDIAKLNEEVRRLQEIEKKYIGLTDRDPKTGRFVK